MKLPLVVIALFLPFILMPANAQDNVYQSKKEKLSSIRSAGKRDSHAIEFLAKYLKDPDSDVRDEAVKAIVNVGTQYSLDPLIQATHDNDSGIQMRATDGLVNFYLPGYVTPGGVTRTFTRVSRHIKDVFASRNDDVIGPGISVRPDVIEALSDLIGAGSSIESRADAARAAGILRGHAALPALEKALQSKDTGLIFESLVAIQKIGDPTAGPSVTFLANDFDAQVQTTAIETLGILHTVEAAPQIRQVLKRPQGDRVKRASLEALSMLAQPDDRTLFIEYKDSKDQDLRIAALEGLGRLRDPQDFPILESSFNDEKELRPRLAAAFALVVEGKLDVTEFSPLRYLVNALDLNKGASTSQAYLQELSRRPEVRNALLPLLPQASKQEKLGLIRALAPNADVETTAALRALTKDPDPDVSIAAARNQTGAPMKPR
jgi:HEAT repeat protein